MTTDVPASPTPGNKPTAASPAGSSRRRPRRRCDDSAAHRAFGAGLGGEDRAKGVLSDEKAQFLAAQLQKSWGSRWQVMWDPEGRKFRAAPAYAMHVNTPVEGRSLRELWRAVLDVDQELLLAMAETISAHPPTLVHVPPPGFLQEVFG
ncbi:hypothetical protein [Nonomuraea basaltis]|uniref:hypothetical protein n=1 Tax=Nonomuraea basaltis TaxID=2495887 RepID=UPI00197DD2C5|nr:hypothetical protein [Nonomuraea basaltis]